MQTYPATLELINYFPSKRSNFHGQPYDIKLHSMYSDVVVGSLMTADCKVRLTSLKTGPSSRGNTGTFNRKAVQMMPSMFE